eukprot:NODE_64_length_24072_cov_0.332541.p8 type:complete len:194 gc:universal NODE_64_length_24072_cov_0.332541:10174-9593(-)
MFTGLVDFLGIVVEIERFSYTIAATNEYLEDVKIGDSIAVNGTCLTVVEKQNEKFKINTTPETMKCTCLGSLKVNDKVNLEKSVLPTTRMGGHFVQGHVDCTVEIINKEIEENSIWYKFRVDTQKSKYIIEKGFVCLDGVSLTACRVGINEFSIMMIPHTQENVALYYKNVGEIVNLEVDMLSKMVERHHLFK